MRTVFVNPSKRRAKRKSAPKARKASKSRATTIVLRAPVRRKRRANAGITPFVSSANRNPMIWPNPRRRAKRRNPSPMKELTLKKLVSNSLANAGGAAIAVGANHFGLSKIKNVWGRNGARAAGALAAGAFIPGAVGAATAGAMFYPILEEVKNYFLKDDDEVVEADLDLLSQDLGAMLDPNDFKTW